jgi:hypothetical protein
MYEQMVGDTLETVTAGDWLKGIGLSIAASVVGGASKLAIRKSWLLQTAAEEQEADSTDAGASSIRSATLSSSCGEKNNDTALVQSLLLTSENYSDEDESKDAVNSASEEADCISLQVLREGRELSSGLRSEPSQSISLYHAETRRLRKTSWLPICLRMAGML